MEVKIDADELCELRKQAKANGYTIGNFTSCAADGCVDHLTLTRDKDGFACSVGYIIAENRELEEERDWWREQAFTSTMRHDQTNELVSDIVSPLAPDDYSYYYTKLEERAALEDYVVD